MPETLKLTSGRMVNIDAVHVQRSMAGFLEGDPDRIWDRALQKAPNRMKGAWGKRRVHLIEPESASPVRKWLPMWQIHVWLTSDHSTDVDAHGSELVVIYFSDDIFHAPLVKLIQEQVKDLDWDRLAADFHF